MKDILKTEDLVLEYRDKQVLAGISFSVKSNDFFTIIGPNGAGKTTLLKAIAGLVKPRNGTIRIRDRNINTYSRAMLSQVMAMVPQQVEVGFPFTVAETVIMGRTPHLGIFRMESSADFKIAEEAMRFTDIIHLAGRKLSQLSGGELQRVIIARAICQQPEIVLLDEPTTALDPSHQLKIMDLMDRLREENNVTVIMVSHDLNLAAMYANRILLMKEGRVVKIGNTESVFDVSLLEEIYGCRMTIEKSSVGEFPRITPVPERYDSKAARNRS